MSLVNEEVQPVRQCCDIFCHVVDNYGDIGVCWRLACQLAKEPGWVVRLWIDDLHGLSKLFPGVNVALQQQHCSGIQVCRWQENFPLVQPADLVIETFACQLPAAYVEAMAVRSPQSIWINLEHLSAEEWVRGCHRLPSPHPALQINKYYFFPGFMRDTGGLLLEQNLLALRDDFQRDVRQQGMFWQSLEMELPGADVLKISLFGYENAALDSLLNVWAEGAEPVVCLVPEGRLLPQVAVCFGVAQAKAGDEFLSGSLRLRVLPFISQQQYDRLLWACDVNFVRGEDSFVRAQWAAKPMVWQIYPQHDLVHHDKLQAFLTLYTDGLPPSIGHAAEKLWDSWNREQDVAQTWRDFSLSRIALERHAAVWAARLAQSSLVGNLLDFYRELGTIRASRILDAEA